MKNTVAYEGMEQEFSWTKIPSIPYKHDFGIQTINETQENLVEFSPISVSEFQIEKEITFPLPLKWSPSLHIVYEVLWKLQDIFRDPSILFLDKKDQAPFHWFQLAVNIILAVFKDATIREDLSNDSSSVKDSKRRRNVSDTEKEESKSTSNDSIPFVKYLTAPYLLTLQLDDSTFRRFVLLQLLIILSYFEPIFQAHVESDTSNLFMPAANSFPVPVFISKNELTWIQEKKEAVLRILEKGPGECRRFSRTVSAVLNREKDWVFLISYIGKLEKTKLCCI